MGNRTTEKHCWYKCPGCGPPKYAADGACPTGSGSLYKNCADKYPGTPTNVGSTAVFPNPMRGVDVHTFAVEDTLQVPAGIPPGDYVLGFRWDCEQTTQIW